MASTPEAGTLPRVEPDELEAYRRELTGYCYRMLGSGYEAEDAVQDTMLRAWRSANRFEGRASVRAWLYRIATNVCMDMLRGRKRRARPMELGPSSSSARCCAGRRRRPPGSWTPAWRRSTARCSGPGPPWPRSRTPPGPVR